MDALGNDGSVAMRRVMRWIGGLVLVAVVGLVGMFALSRLSTPDAVQREALELIETGSVPPAGDNAFDLLWLLPYDVPAAERAAVVDADVARMQRELAGPRIDGEPNVSGESTAEGRYRRVADDADDADDLEYCDMRAADCLDTVREQRAVYAKQLARDAALLARVRELSAYGHIRNRFPPSMFAPFPGFHRVNISATRSALDFAEGNVEAALSGVCRDVTTWRRLGANSDNLIQAVMAAALVEGNARLFADMLAELSLDHPLPQACVAAFDPAAIAPDICPALIGEATWSFSVMQEYPDTQGFLAALVFDALRTRAMAAPAYAHFCTDTVRRQLRDDLPLDPAPGMGSPWRLECAGNLLGCQLVGIAIPAFGGYPVRVQDMQAMIRTVDALVWLRGQAEGAALPPETIATALAMRQTGGRDIHHDAETAELVIKLRGHGGNIEWRVPLPASRLEESD